MPQIYQNASAVLIWLGPPYAGSDEAMDALIQHTASKRSKKRVWSINGKTTAIHISILTTRAYWTRLWIFQEVVLAREIMLMCGDKLAPWQPFKELLLEKPPPRYATSMQYLIMRTSPAMSVVSRLDRHPDRMALLDLIFATKDQSCTDARDWVYALLGTASKGHEDVTPSYDVSISTLLNMVLRNHYQVCAPGSIEEVEDQCRRLDAVFRQQDGRASIFQFVGTSNAPDEKDMAQQPLGRRGSPVTLWWTSYHGHSGVTEMLMNDAELQVSLLLDNGVSTAHVEPSMICKAAESGHVRGLQLLRDAGASFDDALCDASHEYEVNCVANLLAAGANVNAQDRISGEMALYLASIRGHRDIVAVLLDNGAEINGKGNNGTTALYEASLHGREITVELLLAAGADADAHGGSYAYPLQAASYCGSESIVRSLLSVGADVNAQGGLHSNALQAAASGDHSKVVEMLLKAGADVNARDVEGENALQTGSFDGGITVVRILLSAGADVNARGGPYGSALLAASNRGNEEVVKLLLASGADVNARGRRRRNAVKIALDLGHAGIVRIPLAAGAIPTNDIKSQTQTRNMSSGPTRLHRMPGSHLSNPLQACLVVVTH